MRAQLIAVVVALLVASVPACFAQGWDGGGYLWDARAVETTPTQSWFGGSGMIVVPTASTLPQKQLNAHLHAVRLDSTEDWETIWGVTTSIYPSVEMGVTGLPSAFTGDDNELVYHAKIGGINDLLKLGPNAPDIAIGGRDLSNRVNDLYFLTLSKDFELDTKTGKTLGVTLGVGNSGGDNVPLDGFFAGVDFSPFDFARLQIEHDSESLNASLRYWWSEWAITEVGVLDGQFGGGFTVHTGW